MALYPTFQAALRGCGVLEPGDPLVVGVSGGADSIALLHLLTRSRDELDLRLHALHVNHQIRQGEAEADARFVQAVCAKWGVPCRIESVDVPALAARHKLSLEEAARQARYTALAGEAIRVGAGVIAVAHNADDQAETVLMHFLRGSGLAGLRGMLPVTDLGAYHLLEPLARPLSLIRPLLTIPRAAIEDYCQAHHLETRLDSTNLDTTYFRNRLRHEIIPLLETLNPNLRAVLGRTAALAAADYDLLEKLVDDAWESAVVSASGERVEFALEKWRALPLALQRATIRRAAWLIRESLRDVSFEHVEGALRVAAQGSTGAEATLPGGLALRVGYDRLAVGPVDARPPAPDWPLLEPGTAISLSGPGTLALPGSGWRLTLEPFDGARDGPDWEAVLADPWAAPLDAGRLGAALTLRTRQPGDRFHPQGMGGSQKVSDFMINQKIPAAWRDHLPLLVSGGEIAWLCGWRVDARFVVTEDTQTVWIARFEQ
jgi:tRNA(Ile)-lysidine synthetase-like protein